ncbi:hypothetical protein M378DRAFT_17548 [Amanita muscaria Koide BX008]|uniref:Uncharacterized protein n=1 Tax=Amanita muscaria (strain Koide BX008) TaxID=946122 RepID=A0A0C2SPE5_AMAMK|nr:hypothetical protein M378DRAFT_17548 [Amanita muscaria Koide BX008]
MVSADENETRNDIPAVEMDHGSAGEPVGVDKRRRVRERWTYVPVATESSQTTEDLAQRWGHSDPDDDDEGHSSRLTRARKKEVRVSVARGEDGGRLSRSFADLGRLFNRNPEDRVRDRNLDQMEEVEVDDCLRGILTADNSRLRGNLTMENSEEQPEAGGLETEGATLTGDSSATRPPADGSVTRDDLDETLQREGGSLFVAKGVTRLISDEYDYIPGLNTRRVTFPTWFALHESDEELGPLPTFSTNHQEGEAMGHTVLLPEIESSDEDSLVDEMSERFEEIMSAARDNVNASAVLVEVLEEESARTNLKASNAWNAEAGPSKGKGVDPRERGARYEPLRGKPRYSGRGRTNANSLRFSQGPDQFRRADSEKPEGGWFRATTQSPER